MRVGAYEFFAQERIIFGQPVNQVAPEQVAKLGAARVFIVATRTLSRKTDVVTSLIKALGPKFVGLYDDCESHVPRHTVFAATEKARAAQPDLLISIGGGSAVDTGKMVLLCLAENAREGADLEPLYVRTDDAGVVTIPTVKRPPCRQIVIPTTLSGGEFSHTAGCTDTLRHVKDIYIQRELAAPVVILDPAITVHTPEWVWLASGMRAVDHAVSSLCSKRAQPFTDALSERGLAMLATSLRITRQNPADIDQRMECQLGVWLSSMGMMRGQYGASHGLSWHLSAVADVPHGHCSCVLLPSVLRYNAPVNAEQQMVVSRVMGRPDKPAADAVLDLIHDLGLPYRLSQVGIKREHFAKIATDAMHNLLVRNNSRPIERPEDVLEILEMAW